MRVHYYLNLTVFLGCSLLSAGKGLHATTASQPQDQLIKIGSYNLENLWDGNRDNTRQAWEDFLDGVPADERSGFPRNLEYADYNSAFSNWYTPAILNAKVRNVITAIKLMGTPDILALQEVESAGNGSEVFDLPYDRQTTLRDQLSELGYRFFIIGDQEEDNPVAVTTAVISKIAIRALPEVVINFGKRSTSSRDIQAIEATVGNGRLVLFNSHWKSKRGNGESQRIATAEALRARIAEERRLDPSTDIIAVGDFNAAYTEAPLRALGCSGDERLMLGKATPRLYNFWFEMAPASRWEHSFDGTRATLSHMVVSDSLYDHTGLQYVDQSFTAVGQKGEAAKQLLGANGRPYRWQVKKVRATTYHIGKGFSDHLPLVASFRIVENSSEPTRKIKLRHPSQDDKHDDTRQPIIFDEVDVCDPRTAIDVSGIAPGSLEDYDGQCVRVDVPSAEEALTLRTRGKYRNNFITLPSYQADKSDASARYELGITMNREFDWRPNIDDSRVTKAEASIEPGAFNSRREHPHSNKCFVRRVLQGQGGQLRHAVGRLGYSEGFLNLHVASREEAHLILENLPSQKAAACVW